MAVAVAGVVLVLRRPERFMRPTMWAEDGTIYLADAIERGASSLFDGYRGQLFLAQRSVSLVASVFPIAWQPAIYGLVAFAVTLACCSLVLSSRWCAPVSFPVRALCLLALVCMPGTDEIVGTLTNIHWWLAIGLVILGLLDDPRARRSKAAETTLVAVTALSGFAVLYGLPTLIFRAVRLRSRHARVLMIAACAGLVIQLAVLLTSSRSSRPEQLVDARHSTLVAMFVKKIFSVAVIGDDGLKQLWPGGHASSWVWIATAALLASLVVLFLQSRGAARFALLACIVVSWLLGMLSSTEADSSLELIMRPIYGGRYFIPAIAAVYLFVALATTEPRVRLAPMLVASTLLLTGIVSDFTLARRASVEWTPFAACVERATLPCSVVIPPGWPVEVDP